MMEDKKIIFPFLRNRTVHFVVREPLSRGKFLYHVSNNASLGGYEEVVNYDRGRIKYFEYKYKGFRVISTGTSGTAWEVRGAGKGMRKKRGKEQILFACGDNIRFALEERKEEITYACFLNGEVSANPSLIDDFWFWRKKKTEEEKMSEMTEEERRNLQLLKNLIEVSKQADWTTADTSGLFLLLCDDGYEPLCEDFSTHPLTKDDLSLLNSLLPEIRTSYAVNKSVPNNAFATETTLKENVWIDEETFDLNRDQSLMKHPEERMLADYMLSFFVKLRKRDREIIEAAKESINRQIDELIPSLDEFYLSKTK